MIVHVYTIMRNEKRILPYYFRHYLPFVDKFFIYDDYSDDGTREYLAQFDNVVVDSVKDKYGNEVHGIDDMTFRRVYNKSYQYWSRGKRGNADFVICCDADEFIYHPNIVQRLEELKVDGTMIIKPTGYTMFSDTFPSTDKQIYDVIKTGVKDVWYDKPILFNPTVNIRFDIGRHGMRHDFFNLANTRIGENTGIKLLHYRYLGAEYAKARSDVGWERMSDFNKKHGLAKHMAPDSNYFHSARWFALNKPNAVQCID